MAQPASVLNTLGQGTDTPYATGNQPRVKLAIGTKDVGLTPMAAWEGIATHIDGETFDASDGVVALAGVDGSTVRKIIVDSSGRPLVVLVPNTGSVTNRSGTITAGGTQQQLAPALATRKYFFVQNLDAEFDLWINFTTNAVVGQPSIRIGPGESFCMEGSYVSSELISIIAAVTGHAFTAKEA